MRRVAPGGAGPTERGNHAKDALDRGRSRVRDDRRRGVILPGGGCGAGRAGLQEVRAMPYARSRGRSERRTQSARHLRSQGRNGSRLDLFGGDEKLERRLDEGDARRFSGQAEGVHPGQHDELHRLAQAGGAGSCDHLFGAGDEVARPGLFPCSSPQRTSLAHPEQSHMDVEKLRNLQAPLKERYRRDADSAVVTLRARGQLEDTAIACKVETGRALVEAGLHPATGGDGSLACSGDMLLQALVACAGVTLKAVATALEFRLRGGAVMAEGDLDFRGTLGVDKEAPVGFRAIRLRFDLDTDEPAERIATLRKLTERYCVVLQTIRRSPTFSFDVATTA